MAVMSAEQAAEAARGLTFEKVWAALMESRERQEKAFAEMREARAEADRRQEKAFVEMRESRAEMDKRMEKASADVDRRQEKAFVEMRESRAEMDKRMEESRAEADREIKELRRLIKETDRQMKRTDKQLSDLGLRQGEIAERVIMPCLIYKFRKMGLNFNRAVPNTYITDEKNQILAEIDITLENCDKVMIVEVKTKPTTKDIKTHVKRMEIVRRDAALRGDKRKFLGAVAGVVFNKNEKAFTLSNGFFMIEPSGETYNITAPSGEFHPREWCAVEGISA